MVIQLFSHETVYVSFNYYFFILESDICRVCRCEATSDKPLFYPCVCTGILLDILN